ncbi:MAG: hypothetical protein GTO02_18660 [Candidatus Dadabacteria bacterium]|nr:hypothetical protein [Candidatus Dadabacteria bacterium]NIQ16333.1 hypothetical protein [Candidatus Dadabacteria bacterium]
MTSNRFRPILIHTYLHPEEDTFLKNYAENNLLTVSEVDRGCIDEVMKMEDYRITEPRNPELLKRR